MGAYQISLLLEQITERSNFSNKSWEKHVGRSFHGVKTGSAKLSHELWPGQSSLYEVLEDVIGFKLQASTNSGQGWLGVQG